MEHTFILSCSAFIVGFLVNLVVMRATFCSTSECTTNRESCEKERDARWEAIETRLTSIERCMADLKVGWKENYKALCDIKAIINTRHEVS